MKIINYLIIITLFISGCGQPNTSSNKITTEKKDTILIDTTTLKDNTKLHKTAVVLSKLDSIEKANNESVANSGSNITKAYVSLKDGDSTIYLSANIRRDHRIFGYANPGIKSERILLLSIFTNDVENNPFGCKLGAYYDTNGMDGLDLKYAATLGNFVKATATDKLNKSTIIYFEKKWIELE
jgi:hypothetical protein